MSDMTVAVVCPTKDRPEFLERMLESFANQTRRPDEVVIVDAGDGSAREMVESFSNRLPIKYVHWTGVPATTRQKNAGVEALSRDAELVCFFDDDQTAYPDMIEKTLEFWKTAPDDQAGTGCSQVNYDPPVRSRWTEWWMRLGERLGLCSLKPGSVSRGGVHTLATRVDADTDVEWLGGGRAFWRRRILDEFRFDESLVGYGFMEDADFSYGVSRRYRLTQLAGAKFVHNRTMQARPSRYRFGQLETKNRIYFVRKHGLSMPACLAGIALRTARTFARGIVRRDRSLLARGAGNCVGVIAGLRRSERRT
ncbi:MAG: glycosyltransferase family 2 protein [Armatimonadetes bacterium]|nr:glycosyltransferase family 2 protein [Armatimonadota bacterium]